METISLLKRDALIAILLIVLAAVSSYSISEHLNTEGLRKDNVWFQADIGRVYENMTKRSSNHYRTKVHPLLSLTTAPLVHGLSKLGMTKETAVRMLVAGVAGIWLAAFYLVLRLLHIRVTDALVFTIMISLSAATLFWSTVPETYLFGSLTLLLVLGLVALSEARTFAAVYWVAISALSLSMTVTNWMAGITATLASNSLRKTARITIDAFVVVTVFWAIQNKLFPSSEFFLFSLEERNYVFLKDAGGLTEKATVFFFALRSYAGGTDSQKSMGPILAFFLRSIFCLGLDWPSRFEPIRYLGNPFDFRGLDCLASTSISKVQNCISLNHRRAASAPHDIW